MDREQALRELYEEKMQEVFECSANYLMTTPRKGYEDEFYRAKKIAEILKEMIDEMY